MTEQPSDTQGMEQELQRLSTRLTKFIKAHQALQTHAQQLEDENENLKKALEDKNQQVKDFQYQLEISKIVSSVVEGTGNQEELKHKLDEYIEEIDRCINFLSQEL